ncbi:hypothetical protein BG004_005825 [Podila humilis]|nr:hypothetical protein BG004_005825 [Podila humilis]
MASPPPAIRLLGDSVFSQTRLRRKCAITFACLVAVNVAVWAIAAIIAKQYPSLLGSMVIAYTLGLRHAADADHLSAIDNVTRKLIYQDARKAQALDEPATWTPPVCVGLFFSLGHSTIVIVASIVLAITAVAIQDKFEAFGETGGIIGTSVSTAFMFLIGFINLFVLIQVWREFQAIRKTNEYRYYDPLQEMLEAPSKNTESDAEKHVGSAETAETTEDKQEERKTSRFQSGGLFSRIFRPLFKLIDRSWKMYPLGVLFGLGFDTATEVGLLGIAATNARAGFSTAVILIFPALFTAGMSLIDTLDGIVMVYAYGWAFVNPVKKLWYNFVVTLMGVVVAFVVGFTELFALLAEELELQGPFWGFFLLLSDNFGTIGYVILGSFVVTWIFAVIYYKFGPIKDLEKKPQILVSTADENRPHYVEATTLFLRLFSFGLVPDQRGVLSVAFDFSVSCQYKLTHGIRNLYLNLSFSMVKIHLSSHQRLDITIPSKELCQKVYDVVYNIKTKANDIKEFPKHKPKTNLDKPDPMAAFLTAKNDVFIDSQPAQRSIPKSLKQPRSEPPPSTTMAKKRRQLE